MEYEWEEYLSKEQYEFERQVSEFKESLKLGIKKEIKEKIEKLEKENSELRERQSKLKELEDECRKQLREIENKKSMIRDEIRRELYQADLKKLLDIMFKRQTLYKVNSKYNQREKCSCCDKDRKLKFVDGLNREYFVECKCAKNKIKYEVDIASTRLYIEKESGFRSFKMIVEERGDYTTTRIYGFDKGDIFNECLYDEFDENNPPKNRYKAYFTSEEECQKYVDYLNEEENEKGE